MHNRARFFFFKKKKKKKAFSATAVSASVTAIADIEIDIGTQLGRDLRDVLLLIVPHDPRQHGDCKGESDHNPFAG